LSADFEFNGRRIGKHEYNWMRRSTSVIFRILERAWNRQGCVLVDMKIEFGVTTDGEVVLADVIDNDSWRVWPNGDRFDILILISHSSFSRLQLDKQFYRDLPQVTDEALKELKKNYDRVEKLTHDFLTQSSRPRAVIIMGSISDKPTGEKIAKDLFQYGVEPILRVSSAHKSTTEVFEVLAEYESKYNLAT
jgi:phosphoribosylaminoimidazole carboxylase/phosphoribosylaminoimidazole-succinocarboxamide synthase